MIDVIDVFLINANAKRYCNSINAAFQVILRFSFKWKRSKEVRFEEVDRSEKEISKLKRRGTPIQEWWKKKIYRRVPLFRRRRFLYIIQLLLLRRVVPLALAPLSSEHRKRVPKHAPSRPASTRLLF